ncbi:hypothetical protein [Brevibacterium casei]|uniref:DUF3987 domain-containing protein n=1 Tax=Brevibacterium casei TaxID=33889 RepID=A0A7T2THK0_9MICO|nr:hypothetical protein [Brevibacterium casei]QPS33991.1 hypothetical protein I6G59_01210 [Brevibacterium casei]
MSAYDDDGAFPNATPEEIAEQIGNDLWTARPELTTIRDSARASLASPYAVLGCTLASVAEALPPSVVLPPTGNGTTAIGSLNVFFALVAPSGVGKGVATRTAEGVLDQKGPRRDRASVPLGTGEGIAASFIRSDATREDPPEDSIRETSVRFDVPEIDTLTALSGRQNSIVDQEIRKMWVGEALGTGNASPATRRIIPSHLYRASIIAGVQPKRAAGLIRSADGGTLQRFVFLPAIDPEAPDETPPLPPSLEWESPFDALRTSNVFQMRVDPFIREEMRVTHMPRLRGQVDDDNGHREFSRLKIAALLGVLNGRRNVENDDWHLAGLIMSQSDRTLEWIRGVLSREHKKMVAAKGRDSALKESAAEDAHISSAVASLRKALNDGRRWTRGDLRRRLTSSTRKYVDNALDRLAASGEVYVWTDDGTGSPVTYIQSVAEGEGVAGWQAATPTENPGNMRNSGGGEPATYAPTPPPPTANNSDTTATPGESVPPLRSANSRGSEGGGKSATPPPPAKKSKTPRQQDLVLAYITEHGASSPKEIAAGLADVIPGFSSSKASVALDRLHKDEAIVSVGHGVWNLPGAADPQVDGQLSMFPDSDESDGRKAS